MAIKFKTRGWSDEWTDRFISNRENLRIKEAQKRSTLKIPLSIRTGIDFQLDRTTQFPRKKSKFIRLPGSRKRVEVFLQRDGTWKPTRELADIRGTGNQVETQIKPEPLDQKIIEEKRRVSNSEVPITQNQADGISPELAGKLGLELDTNVRYLQSTQGQNTVGQDSTPSETPPIQKREELVINKAENNVFTIDPATGKPVGVITRSKRRELQKRLNQQKLLEANKLKNKTSTLTSSVA